MRIVRLSVLTAILASSAMMPSRAAVPISVYAHRGGAALAPENTLGAFRQAHAMYGDRGVWLEMDVQQTRDPKLVVIHDDSLDRTTNCTGTVITKFYHQIDDECDARKTFPTWPTVERIPLFDDVLREGKSAGWRIMAEIKNIPGQANFDPQGQKIATALVASVKEASFPLERIQVQSFWPPALEYMELLEPRIHTVLLTTSQLPGAPPGAGFTLMENAAFATARGYEISAPDDAAVDLERETVAAARSLGRRVVLWTINHPDRVTRAIMLGVDGIISDRPDLVYEALG